MPVDRRGSRVRQASPRVPGRLNRKGTVLGWQPVPKAGPGAQIGPRIIPKSGGQEATLLPPGGPRRPFVATVAVSRGHGDDYIAGGGGGDNFYDSAVESVASARTRATSTVRSRRRPGSSLRCRNAWWARKGSGMDPDLRRGGPVGGER